MSRKHNIFTLKVPGHLAELKSPVTVAHPADHTRCFDTMALWDTGAQMCFISRKLMNSLGLEFDSEINGHGIFSTGSTLFGTVSIRIVSGGRFFDVKAGVVDNLHRGHDCHALIGMNLICRGQMSFSFDNGVSTFSFSLPAVDSPDLVDKAVSKDIPADFDYFDLSSGAPTSAPGEK